MSQNWSVKHLSADISNNHQIRDDFISFFIFSMEEKVKDRLIVRSSQKLFAQTVFVKAYRTTVSSP